MYTYRADRLSFEEKVEKELKPFKDGFKKIMARLTSNEKFDLGQLLADAKNIIKQAVIADELSRENLQMELLNDDLTTVLLPYVALVRSRGRIEYYERLFSLTYSPTTSWSNKTLNSSATMYEYHLKMWQWIWDNCKDKRFLDMKNAAINEFNNNTALAKDREKT